MTVLTRNISTRDPRRGHAPIGLLLKTYPKLSETFVLGEILGLEALGVPLAIFSLQQPTDAFAHAQVGKVRAAVRYVTQPARSAMAQAIAAHARVLARHPRGYLRALRETVGSREPDRWSRFVHAGMLANELEAQRIRHVHAHFASEPAALAAVAATMIGGTYSISAHAKDIYMSDPVALAQRLRGAQFTVTCTEYNRHHLQRIGGPGASVHRMYHGIDLERFARRTGPQGRNQVQPPVILSVGRLREKKGFPTLIEACAQLVARQVPFRCEIIGYGPDEAVLRARIVALGLSHCIHLLGKRAQHEVIEAYARATLFVLPCQIGADGDRDGIPNVLLEAMSMQLPVISTPVSGIPEVIEHDRNGLLVPAQDVGALAHAMERLIMNPAQRAALGMRARDTVARQFSNARNLVLVRDLLTQASRAPSMNQAAVTAERQQHAS